MSVEKGKNPFLLNVFKKSLSIALLGITGGLIGGALGGFASIITGCSFFNIPLVLNSTLGQFFGCFSGAITAASLAPGPANSK